MIQNLFLQEIGLSFILVLSRVSGFITASPILGAKSIPKRTKIMLALLLSLVVFISLPKAAVIPRGLVELGLLILGQLVIGFLLGATVSFAFAGLQAGGALIDLQVGYSMSSLVDPQSGVMSTVVSRWHYMLATMVFLGLDGHHWLVLGIINSFKALPPAGFGISHGLANFMIKSFSDILKIELNSAIPVLIAVILVDVTAGFIARTAPKLHILIISFPFKIFLGIFMMIASFSALVFMFSKWLGDLQIPLLRAFYL